MMMNNLFNNSGQAERKPQGAGTNLKWLVAASMLAAVFAMSSCKNDDKPSVRTFTITFIANGGGAVERQMVAEGKTVAMPSDPTREGYVFEGWYTDEELTASYDFATPVSADIALYAKWEAVAQTEGAQTFTVTFITGEGSTVDAQTVAAGDAVARPEDPTREGYAFEEWYTDEALTASYDFATPVSADVTLYAKWEVAQTFTVTFITGEGSTNVDAQTVAEGAAAARPADPTREGYAFEEWYSDEGLTAVYDFATPVSADITLYAKWRKPLSVADLQGRWIWDTEAAFVTTWTYNRGLIVRGERNSFADDIFAGVKSFTAHWTFTNDNRILQSIVLEFTEMESELIELELRYTLDAEQNIITTREEVDELEGMVEERTYNVTFFDGRSLELISPNPVREDFPHGIDFNTDDDITDYYAQFEISLTKE